MGTATFCNRLLSGAIALSFFSLVKAITASGAFFLFSVLSLVSVWFTIYYVPETKGKSLEEIERYLHAKNSNRGERETNGGHSDDSDHSDGGGNGGGGVDVDSGSNDNTGGGSGRNGSSRDLQQMNSGVNVDDDEINIYGSSSNT